MQPTNCHHRSLQKGENNNRSPPEAVMSVATWPVSKHSVPFFFSETTFSYSIYEPPTIDGDRGSCVRLTVGQSSSVHRLSNMDVNTHRTWQRGRTNHRFHRWRSINSWCSSIVIDGMNAHRSAIDEPVSERATCLQAVRYLTRCH